MANVTQQGTKSQLYEGTPPGGAGDTIFVSPIQGLSSPNVRDSRGNLVSIEYVSVFNQTNGATEIYQARRGPFGGILKLRAQDRLAVRTDDGKYEPVDLGKRFLDGKRPNGDPTLFSDLMGEMSNNANVIASLDANRKYTYQTGFQLKNQRKPTDQEIVDALNVPPDGDGSNPDDPPAAGDGGGGGDGDAPPRAVLVESMESSNALTGESGSSNFSATDLRYPLGVPDIVKMDYVRFTALDYAPSAVNSSGNFGVKQGKNEILGSSVYLPIQGTIADANGVGWNEETLNPLQIFGAGVAMQGIENGGEGLVNALQGAVDSTVSNNAQLKKAIKGAAVNSAISANILPRTERAIFNPNTELLFNGPQLRAFTFTFKLTPRNKPEADNIKNIIRFFKLNMAAKTTTSALFLKAPNVFRIEYLFQNDQQHPGLNLIKDCALQNFAVDYTPDGSYMTVGDEGAMFSYNLTMSFMELLPIYSKDYDSDEAKNHPIGY